jgi:hypothetical protein
MPHLNSIEMRKLYSVILVVFFWQLLFAQSDVQKIYIFIPHPRSEDKVHQSVLPSIEQINFSKFDIILLGGDLTYYTSIDRISMDYCDSLFDLDNPNTLWTMGNHDLNTPALIEEYTTRPDYYSYFSNNITFLVLSTEIDADGFASSHISADQLEFVRNICNTITNTDFLVLLHHRLLWMIGDEYFSTKIDSVGESTRQLDTSNFNAEIFPLLQNVKKRGIKILCLGGDKSRINIEYSPEDSITYIASTMAPEFSDEENDVVILTHDILTHNLSWEFIPLSKVEKYVPATTKTEYYKKTDEDLQISYYNAEETLDILWNSEENYQSGLRVYSIQGTLIFSGTIQSNEKYAIPIYNSGIYLICVEGKFERVFKKIFIDKNY